MIVLPKDMNDVEATREFNIAPAGTYEFEIKKATQGKSKNNNVKVDFRYEIIGDQDYNGTGVFDTITITENALFRLKQLSLATGIEIGTEFDPQDFVGATFEATINIETYTDNDGVVREKNSISKYIFPEQ